MNKSEEFLKLSSELAEQIEIDRGHLVALLPALFEAKAARDAAAKDVDRITKLFKGWLDKHPDEVIWCEHKDGDMEARLAHRKVDNGYSVAEMPPALVLELLDAKALEVDRKIIEALQGKSALPVKVAPFKNPDGVSAVLVTEQKK